MLVCFRMIIGSGGNFAQTRRVMSILLIAFACRQCVLVFVILYLVQISSLARFNEISVSCIDRINTSARCGKKTFISHEIDVILTTQRRSLKIYNSMKIIANPMIERQRSIFTNIYNTVHKMHLLWKILIKFPQLISAKAVLIEG